MENLCAAPIEFRKFLVFLFLAFTVSICPAQNLSLNDTGRKESAFIKNQGQIIDQTGKPNPHVLYLLNTPGLNVQLKKNGFSYDTYEPEERPQPDATPVNIFNKRKITKAEDNRSRRLFHRIDFEFVDSNPKVEISEMEETTFFQNFYNVPGTETGFTGVGSFKRIYYRELYPGIDVEFFVPEDPAKPVEYNFIVHPTGKIEDIRMKISGANVTFTPEQLELTLIHGTLSEIIPASWNGQGKQKSPVLINYTQPEENIFGFKYADTSQRKENTTLTIDPTPVRQWATYFGGEETDSSNIAGIGADSEGNVTIAGVSRSHTNIATSGRPESLHESDIMAYLAKFDPDGSLIWSTYYGGYRGAAFYDLALDSRDNIIAVGATYSENNIATPGAHQTVILNAFNQPSGIMVKFDKNGERIWGTYYGGDSFDNFLSVIVDPNNNNIYAGGYTSSNENIATADAFRNAGDLIVHFNTDAFLVKMNANGERQWATYYGGDSHDNINSMAMDSRGNILVTGDTGSLEGIATPGAYQTVYGNGGYSWNDAFLAKISPTGQLLWGTYFGGWDYDFGTGVAVDNENHVILTGNTRNAEDIASVGAHQETKGGDFNTFNAFLAKFTSEGQLQWSTFYGGSGGSGGSAVKVTAGNDIFMAGSTGSGINISTPDAFQPLLAGSSDVFLTKFTPTGQRIWGTYYGGESLDEATNMALTMDGTIYIVGRTYSTTGISTPGVHQEKKSGQDDAFLVKFKDCLSGISAEAPAGVCEGADINLKASGGTSYLWTGPNGFSSTIASPVISAAKPTASGTYYAFISSGGDCDETLEFEVLVTPAPIAYPIEDTTACEDEPGSGIASFFNLTNLEARVLQDQTGMIVSWYDEAGKLISAPSATYKNNTPHKETLTLRVANSGNPSCYAETSFDLIINPLPPITIPQDLTICDNDTDGFASFQVGHLEKEITGNNSSLDAIFLNSSGEELDFSGTFQNTEPGTQSIKVQVINKNTGCNQEFDFDLLVHPAPVAHSINDIIGCDDNSDGISEYFNVNGIAAEVLQGQTGLEIRYFKSDGSEILNLSSPYTNKEPFEETLTVRLTHPGSGCFAETQLRLKTSAAPVLNSPVTLYTCDEGNGIGGFATSTWTQQIIGNQSGLTLTWYDGNENVLPGPLPSVYRNRLAYGETLTVKVENSQNPLCYSMSKLELVVNKLPEFNLQDTYIICGLEPFLELKFAKAFDSWEWTFQDGSTISNTPHVVLRDEGNYNLKVGKFENGILCEETHSFKLIRSVLPSIADINYKDWSSRNYIEIIAGGDGDLEYSIDGINYKDSNFFENLPGGIYPVYVRDKNGCGMASSEVMLLDYPRFFTPNDDGYNDLWQLQGMGTLPEVSVLIFDRFGKLLKEISSRGAGWDGTFNNKAMPADDYWFSVDLNEKTFKAHFTLKR